jgi:hypothetical protein
MVLEKAVGDGAQSIVRAGERLANRLFGSWIVEAGQEHQRAVPHEPVGMFRHGSQQNGDRLSRSRAADGPGRVRSCRVVEIAELVHRRLELFGGDRLWCGGLLGLRSGEIAAGDNGSDTQRDGANDQDRTSW